MVPARVIKSGSVYKSIDQRFFLHEKIEFFFFFERKQLFNACFWYIVAKIFTYVNSTILLI